MKASRRILITGASGFVGESLARHFVARGYAVAGTFRSHPLEVAGADLVGIDLTDAGAVRHLLRDMRPSGVVHCAAATAAGWCEENPEEARAAILGATENLCAGLRELGGGARLLHFSTDLVFDGEGAPYRVGAAAKPLGRYGSLKLLSETAVGAVPGSIVIRPALVYGPPGTHSGSFLTWMVQKLCGGEAVTLFSDEWRTPVFIDDLAGAVELLLDTPADGRAVRVFHAGGPERLSRVEMGRVLCEVFRLPVEGMKVRRRAEVPGGSMRARDVSLDSAGLIQLGWKQTPFREGLARCLERWSR